LRSTDVYPYLAKKGLIEKDRHQGLHFRSFLIKLKEHNLLKLIPQCTCKPGLKYEFNEWYFYRATPSLHEDQPKNYMDEKSIEIIIPEATDEEIEELIAKAKPYIEKLPKRNTTTFTDIELGTRKNYPKAYEFWADKEIEILIRAYSKFKKIDKVAKLLERQPSAVEKRLCELELL